MTVRPPTQPPAEPLITVELSYIINVSEGPDGDPADLPPRPVSGTWSVLVVGLACVGAAVAEQMTARAGVLLTRTVHIFCSPGHH